MKPGINCILVAVAAFAAASTVQAGEIGQFAGGVLNIRDYVMPDPGLYTVIYNYYYTTDQLNNSNGDQGGSLGVSVAKEISRPRWTPEDMTSKALLSIAAIFEAMTGLALLVQPSLVMRLLLGETIPRSALVLGRLAGLGLVCLAIACWPRIEATIPRLRTVLVYNLLATAGLGYLRFSSRSAGKLLLPALAVHAVLTILFLGVWPNISLVARANDHGRES